MRYKLVVVVAVCTVALGACSQKKQAAGDVIANDTQPSARSASIAVTQLSAAPVKKPGNEEISEKTQQVASQAEATFRQALKEKFGK
jgi:hypothetical protein